MSRSAEYLTIRPETEEFDQPPSITLLARTTSTLPPEDFTPDQWQELNAATIISGQSARTCYSRRPQQPLDYLNGKPEYRDVTDGVIRSTRDSGHLTTRQHVYYLFELSGVSRHLTWKVLHSYPHHNSEQQSQRYVTMTPEGLMLPHLQDPELDAIFQQSGIDLIEGYQELTQMLAPLAKHFHLQRFPAHSSDRWQAMVDKDASKKAQEIARYLLPWGFRTSMYHSISQLTLLRYHRLKQTYQLEPEASLVIDSMIQAVLAVDPDFLSELDDPIPLEQTPEFNLIKANFSPDISFFDETDAWLNGASARFTTTQTDLAHQLAQAVRFTLSASSEQYTDVQLIDLILNPKNNPLLASVYGEMTMHQLSQVLNQINLSAVVALSHVSDSQLQRHRSILQTQPIFPHLPRLESDIVIPRLIAIAREQGHPEILERYLQLHAQIIEVQRSLLESGVSPQTVAYLNTNAAKIRKSISAPLGAFFHFIKSRTCLNAQEEIFNIAVDLARQLPDIDSAIASHFNKPAPCGVRQKAGATPICPEGSRFCGVPIWKLDINDYPNRDI